MLNILPPYEFKNKLTGWHRGGIKFNQFTAGSGSDFVVTGPKLRVVFDGCRWNRVVFAMTNEEEISRFRAWLSDLESYLEMVVNASPAKYKINPSFGLGQIKSCIQAPSETSVYAEDLRCRLSVKYSDDADKTAISDADLFMVDESGQTIKIDPSEIKNGWSMIPVFKISYQKMANSFYLVLTVLKARVFPFSVERVQNEEWELDYPMDVSN